METYKVIEGFEGSSVSDVGNVKEDITMHMFNVSLNSGGYKHTRLSTGYKVCSPPSRSRCLNQHAETSAKNPWFVHITDKMFPILAMSKTILRCAFLMVV
jgi:hypothetical protein